MGPAKAKIYTPILQELLPKFRIDTPQEIAAFMAQAHHESLGFNKLVESTNYTTVKRLMQVFKKYFPTPEIAAHYVGKPVGPLCSRRPF